MNRADKFVESLVKSLDISENNYKNAVKGYESFGKWLNRRESLVANFGAKIYPQGSFALGTAIKPINDRDDYDIDLVCEVYGFNRDKITQEDFKSMIGVEVKRYHQSYNFKEPIEEGRRCWTLNYAEVANFHMDILPAIFEKGNDVVKNTKIYITDKTADNYHTISKDWPTSNPKAYQNWFKERNTTFKKLHRILAESKGVSIDDVPEYLVKTPLQKVIQIAKRHRDLFFKNYERKPISIIITTLFAKAYNGEESVEDIFRFVVPKLIKQFESDKEGNYRLRNPVNQDEFFTDRWKDNDEKKFIWWLREFSKVVNVLCGDITDKSYNLLRESFGSRFTNKALCESIEEKIIIIENPNRPWRTR